MENNVLKILVVDRHIPFIKGLLEPYANVIYLDGDAIDAKVMAGADALITRTRTHCDRTILEGSRCRFIGTATIGTDHIDSDYCTAHGIEVVNAPGCNAPAVAQYVLASIAALINRPVSQYTVGVVGVGHVGRIVRQWCRSLDMDVMVCDPPRQEVEGGDGWSTLNEIARHADIITFHTPLTDVGPYATRHMADDTFFDALRRSPILINAARGPIVDTRALCRALSSGKVSAAVIDCWEGEPAIDRELLQFASVATPHIAGYSRQGKVRATQMVVDALTKTFGLPDIVVDPNVDGRVPKAVKLPQVVKSYDPLADTARLREQPEAFEQLRNNYHYREEVI